jgi:UDP-glucose:(heptosyl)LPS alpha-1,3-glucosyltransferase
MRLAIVRQDYRPDGTTERVTERALEALLERNVAVSFYTRSWPQTRLQLVEPRVFDPFHVGALWRDWSFARAVCRDVRRSQPDLVESHERLLCCDVYRAADGVHAVWQEERARRASPAARLLARLSPHDRYRARVERRLYSSPWLRAVICNSAMVKDEIRERFAVPEAKLHVIPNPVDHDLFNAGVRSQREAVHEQLRIDPAATVFLLAAADFARAGLASAIDAFARLAPPAHFIAVGDDPAAVRYVARADARGVADRVTFVRGLVDRRTYFGAADAFVLPSLYDPAPDVALEAMACELPMVTSTKSGAASLVLQSDAGLVAAAGDVPALAAHMASLQDPALRTRLGANARRAVLPLSRSAITLQQVLLYRDLLASPGPPTLVAPVGAAMADRAGVTP